MNEIIQNWPSTLLSLIALVTVVWGWFTHGGDKAQAELEKFKTSVNAEMDVLKEKAALRHVELERDHESHDRRIQRLEDALTHLPTSNDFHKIELSMTELIGVVKVLSQKVDTTEGKVEVNAQVVARVDTYLRESGK